MPSSNGRFPAPWPLGQQREEQLEGDLFSFSLAATYYLKPQAVPSGAAQGAHYPVGTRGDIQAVTVCRRASKVGLS